MIVSSDDWLGLPLTPLLPEESVGLGRASGMKIVDTTGEGVGVVERGTGNDAVSVGTTGAGGCCWRSYTKVSAAETIVKATTRAVTMVGLQIRIVTELRHTRTRTP